MNKKTMVITQQHVWRFGYGSNIGLTTLQQKKNLNPSKYLPGIIKGWELYFTKGIPHVEPGWAAVRPSLHSQLHGSAFCIPKDEADGLDRQEAGYDVLSCQFVAYNGEVVEDVGLYVPKKRNNNNNNEKTQQGSQKQEEDGIPSLRYLRLLQNGAKEAPLSQEWQNFINSFEYYVTPPEIRSQTEKWIKEFHSNEDLRNTKWTSDVLSKYDGSNPNFPIHTSIMEYIVSIPDGLWVFPSWKGHNVTRRNLLQFRGKSLDTNDIRYGEEGYRPFPLLHQCSDEEKEFIMQNLDSILHRGGKIVGILQDFLDDQKDLPN